jgi:hypothetical protein
MKTFSMSENIEYEKDPSGITEAPCPALPVEPS